MLPGPADFPAPCFRIPELPGAWAAASNSGLYHKITHEELPVTFDRDAAAERTDVVLLHLGHPLVQMCLRLLRAELWVTGRQDREGEAEPGHRAHRPHDRLRVPAVVGHIRVVMTGEEGTRLHEEVVLAGGTMEGGGLPRRGGEPAGAAARPPAELPPDQVRSTSLNCGPACRGPLAGLSSTAQADPSPQPDKADRRAPGTKSRGHDRDLDELEESIRRALDDTPRGSSQSSSSSNGTPAAPPATTRRSRSARFHPGES